MSNLYTVDSSLFNFVLISILVVSLESDLKTFFPLTHTSLTPSLTFSVIPFILASNLPLTNIFLLLFLIYSSVSKLILLSLVITTVSPTLTLSCTFILIISFLYPVFINLLFL